MSRYIDASEITFYYGGLAQISPFDYVGISKYFAKQIHEMPTADVEPVRHGHWIYAAGDKRYNYFACSECGERVQIETYEATSIVRIKFPYSHCGAKMDGKENEYSK